MHYNEGDIEKHLTRLTSRWDEIRQEAIFEIRCIKEGGITVYEKFNRQEIDDAITYAAKHNSEKYNVYVTVNPIKKNTTRAASDEDVICSFYCFCDCDTEESVKNYNALSDNDNKGNFAIYTGQKPKRGHIYYELDQPTRDMETWTNIQRGIANKIHSDPVVNNPSRIMRLAGTINYPSKNKQINGRVTELSEYRNFRSDIRSIQTLKKVFPYQTTPEFRINLDDLTTRERLDIENTIRRIKSGDQWHDNMIRVVASLVARGRQDHEIHSALSDITLQGYSQSDTDREVTKAIEGARSKGFTGLDRTKSQDAHFHTIPPIEDMFKRWLPLDPLLIPRRQFLYGNHYIKDYLSLTVAPGGVGKSTLVMTEILAMVTGKALLGITPEKKCNAMYFNAEDPLDEVQRRILALCQHYEIPQEDLSGLMVGSGRDTEMLLMSGEEGLMNDALLSDIQKTIIDNEIDVVVIDPLASVINSAESVDNFRMLGKTLSALADKGNCSIELVHHTRKLNPKMDVSVEDSRGGSSLIAAVRSARILRNMSQTDGQSLGIDHYVDYFKIEPAGKNNLSRPLDKVHWHKKIGVQIPNGDYVAVVEDYTPPNAFDGITITKLRLLWDSIKTEQLYLMSHISTKRNEYKMSIHEYVADFLDFSFDAPITKSRVKKIIRTWLENDVLVEEEVSQQIIEPKSYRPKNMVKIITVGRVKP